MYILVRVSYPHKIDEIAAVQMKNPFFISNGVNVRKMLKRNNHMTGLLAKS